MIFFDIFFATILIGKCVVIGHTDISLLYISIAVFDLLNFFEIYSVIPGNFFFRKSFLFIGPFINLLLYLDFINLKAISNDLLI